MTRAEILKTHYAVHKAVAKGILIRPEACLQCGARFRTHGHHADYSKPLDVEWLCGSCHALRHPHGISRPGINCRGPVFGPDLSEARAIFKRNKGASIRLASELGVSRALVSALLLGVRKATGCTGDRVVRGILRRAEELAVNEEQLGRAKGSGKPRRN